jgi:hypothetical protein
MTAMTAGPSVTVTYEETVITIGAGDIRQALAEVIREVHDLHAACYPRRHRDRCRACNPHGNPGKLAVDGHEYQRRQKARQRRRNG